MGNRANLVIVRNGDWQLYYDHWCAYRLEVELFWGPELAASFMKRRFSFTLLVSKTTRPRICGNRRGAIGYESLTTRSQAADLTNVHRTKRDRVCNVNPILPAASASVIEVNGRHGKGKTTLSDRVFYVLEGEGELVVGDDIFPVRSTDVIVVPRDTPFYYSGKMKLFLVQVPAYYWDHEVSLA